MTIDKYLDFKNVRSNMVNLCKKNSIHANYNSRNNHSIQIPGFNLNNGYSEDLKWEKSIAYLPVTTKQDVKDLRKQLNNIQDKTSKAAKIDCSSYTQVVFLAALINTIKSNTILKNVILSMMNPLQKKEKNIVIAPAGAYQDKNNKLSAFLYDIKNYIQIHEIDTKDSIESLIETYNLKEGDIVYIENHKDYEKWAKDGPWAGEWCILTSTQPDNVKVFGFGPGEYKYNEMILRLAENAYCAKKKFDTKILGSLNKCIKDTECARKSRINEINSNKKTHYILNNKLLIDEELSKDTISYLDKIKGHSQLNELKKSIKKSTQHSKESHFKSIKKQIYVSEIIKFDDLELNKLFQHSYQQA